MNDFMITNYDYNGVEASYSMKPAFNLFSNLGFMSETDAKGIENIFKTHFTMFY